MMFWCKGLTCVGNYAEHSATACDCGHPIPFIPFLKEVFLFKLYVFSWQIPQRKSVVKVTIIILIMLMIKIIIFLLS